MRKAILAAALLAPLAAIAEEPPDVVLVPRAALLDLIEVAKHPAATREYTVDVIDAVRSCMSIQRSGQVAGDRSVCPPVWTAQAAQQAAAERALEDAKATQKAEDDRQHKLHPAKPD